MTMKKENINNLISDDLTKRNENWTEIDNTFALLTTQLAEKVQNFKLKNEVENGDFSDGTNGWSIGSNLENVNVLNNELRFKGLGWSDGSINQVISQQPPVTKGVNYLRLSISLYDDAVKTFRINLIDNSSVNAVYQTLQLDSGTISVVFSEESSKRLGISGGDVGIKDVTVLNLTQIFGEGNEPTKLEMDELMKVIPNQWWDGELSLTQKQFITWQLNLIRKNTNAIIALGGTII